jgi:hypothetical protein
MKKEKEKEQDDPGSYPGSSEGSDPSDNLVVCSWGSKSLSTHIPFWYMY